jgi:PAS domain-containing protein
MLDLEFQANEFRPLAAEGSVVVLRDGTISSANERAAAAFGSTVRRFVGGNVHAAAFEAIAPNGRPVPAEDCPVAVVLATGQAVRDVELGIRAVGVTTWWWVSCQPLVDESTAVVGVSCSLTPVVNVGSIGGNRLPPLPVDAASGAVDLETLAELAGLVLPQVAPAVPSSPWARSA